ncbi:MAG TPA: flagellar assembly protein FliH [Stellaceae bacterium]|nr:flagellar assembly protein FliH [Stellaceae bacterium]
MRSPRKYLFDVSFDEPDPPVPAGTRRAPDPVFTRADLDAARAESFAQGHVAALAEAARSGEARATDALTALERDAAALIEARDAIARDAERDAVALLRTVLGKAVPALCRKEPLAEIEALVVRCLGETLDEPRLVLRVNDALFDALQPRLAAIAQANGYAGKIVLLADAALAPGDGRVEWADGGAERDTCRLMAEIDAILTRILDTPTAGPRPSEENLNG